MSNGKEELKISVNIDAYPLEVIYRVCYQFTDNYYLWLDPVPDGVLVRIRPKEGIALPESLEGEFGNTLIDYAVRWSVARETHEVRNRIVTTALAEAMGGGGRA